jgi:hypothetical protein
MIENIYEDPIKRLAKQDLDGVTIYILTDKENNTSVLIKDIPSWYVDIISKIIK